MIAMSVYVALLLLVWPLARETAALPFKILCALAPVVPLLYVIALMARRILQSDELEQRTHLIGLGVATAVISIFCIAGGFLAVSKVITQDVAGLVLLWVFPILVLTYSGARAWVARRYGGGGCDDEESPLYQRFLAAAALVAAVAAYAYFYKHDLFMTDFALGMASALALGALVFGLRQWSKRRHVDE
jgi:hypothetical protein